VKLIDEIIRWLDRWEDVIVVGMAIAVAVGVAYMLSQV